jgi:hypothetical protein
VARTRDGESPNLEGGGEAGPIETIIKFSLLPEETAVVHAAVRRHSEEAGRGLSVKDSFLRMCAESLAGGDSIAKVWEEARKDVAAEEPTRVEEAPWVAVAAEEEPCPAAPEVLLVKPAPAHWTNTKLRFNGQARLLTPAQRREILRRDGYACCTPDCPNRLWLQVHHIVFYCRSGATVPSNLTLCCSRCHANIHKGLLRVRGEAPELSFSDGKGHPVGGSRQRIWLGLLALP